MPDADSSALAVELRRVGLTEIETAVRRRAEYSSDASNYRVVPQVVAYPRHVDEVVAAMSVARSAGVAVTARGAGTSIAGNAIGPGLVLDLSQHLNRVLSVDSEARTATVEPGAILDRITDAARAHRLRFGPDPSTHGRATIGGAIGNNACGSRALKYGRTADNVVELDVLTSDGARFTARSYERDDVHKPGKVASLLELIDTDLATVRTEFGRFRRQVSGYSLEHLLPENGGDVARFLVGTEGTLGLVLGATVRLVESPAATVLAVLGYPDMPSAADAVPGLLPHVSSGALSQGIVAMEGMDSRLVDVVRTRRGASAVPPLPRGGGWLFVETAGQTEAEASAAAEKIVADAGCLDSSIVTGHVAQALWRIREDGAGLGGRTVAGTPAWPGWEDAAVPPERLGAYLRDFATLMADHGVDALTYGHFGDGCVHARIDFPLSVDGAGLRRFVIGAATLVGRYGGSLSGEHGDGRAHSELLPYMYSPQAIDLFAGVKRIFDPENLLNPGVMVDGDAVDTNLRVPQAKPHRTGLGFAYPADQNDLTVAVHRCVGVGKCRANTTPAGGVMCPSYLATHDEKDSTRGRARVLQELTNGQLIDGVHNPAVAESLDLCLSCKGCSADCPAGVDMATYKAEVMYQRYRRRVRPASHYALGWLPRWAKLAARAPRLANAVIGNRMLAAAAKRAGGIDARRPLPKFATHTFRERFRRRRTPEAATPVVLFVDTFTEHFTPEVGTAAVRVLEAAGYAPRIVDEPVCCGLTWISTGQLDGARRQLRQTAAALARAAADGAQIVGLEPSCTAVLREDAGRLLPGNPDVESVAARTRTLAELLTATPGWKPPDLADVHAVAQPHCHQHAVMGWSPDAELLRTSGAQVDAVGGCCGLAGNFGVERGHYDVSTAVAEIALLPAVRSAPDDAVVLADGFSCRTQLDQLADVEGVHLAQLLADHLPGASDE